MNPTGHIHRCGVHVISLAFVRDDYLLYGTTSGLEQVDEEAHNAIPQAPEETCFLNVF